MQGSKNNNIHAAWAIAALCFCMLVSGPATQAQEHPAVADTARILATIDHAVKLKYRDIDGSIVLLNAMLKESKQLNFDYGIAKAFTELGYTYNVLGDLKQSLAYFNLALPHCYKCPFDKTLLPKLYLDEARCYTNQGDYQTANTCFYKAMREISANDLEDSLKLNLDFSLGLFSVSLNQYDKALGYFHECEKLAGQKKDTIMQIISVLNQGEMYIAKGALQEAYLYTTRGEAASYKYGYPNIQGMALSDLGDIYSKQGKPEQAINYYKKGISLFNNKDSGSRHLQFVSYYSLASAYYSIHDFTNAKKVLYPLVKKAQALSIDNQLGTGLVLLGNISAREGRYQEAAKWFQSYIAYENRISNRQNTDAINKLELKYLISEKDKQIAQKQLLLSEQQVELKNKDIWIGGVSACVIVLSTLVFSFYRHNRHKQRIQAERIYSLEQQQEIGQLKAMLQGEDKERTRLARELHDGIVGQLSAVKLNLSLIQKRYGILATAKDFQETVNDLDEAAKDLRKTTHNLMPDLLQHNGLAGAVDTFCEKINKTSALQIYFHLSGYIPTLDPDFELSIYRIVQELINNIIKHARASQALVQISCYEPSLLITIEDNGIGLNKEIMSGKVGIGLSNIKERITVLKGNFEIKNGNESGTIVNMEFDINHLKKQPSCV